MALSARREVAVGAPDGLHARPAALFVQAATLSGLDVRIGTPGGDPVDARSMLAVLSLGVRRGETVVLTAAGAGADEALDGLAALLAGPATR